MEKTHIGFDINDLYLELPNFSAYYFFMNYNLELKNLKEFIYWQFMYWEV